MSRQVYSKEEMRRYLVRYHLLTAEEQVKGKHGIQTVMQKIKIIQYDPLNVVGRNPDLVLFARVTDYRKQMLDQLLYADRILLDHWDKNMSIVLRHDWTELEWARGRQSLGRPTISCKEKIVYDYLQHHEYVTARELAMSKQIAWGYHTASEGSALLEIMMHQGKLQIIGRNGNEKRYALASFTQNQSSVFACGEDEEYLRFVLRRLQATGMLWDKNHDGLLGRRGINRKKQNELLHVLVRRKLARSIGIQGSDALFYIPYCSDQELAEATRRIDEPVARFLAPLDNLLWDRELIAKLFDFVYRFEVYVPKEKRRHGYYVLPILYGENLVGRIEFAHFSKSKRLEILRIWWENGCENSVAMADMQAELHRLYTCCEASYNTKKKSDGSYVSC